MIAMMWGYGNGRWDGAGMHVGWGAGWIAMAVLLLLVVVATAALVLLLIRSGGRATPQSDGAHGPSGEPDALRILEVRFARGEIDEEEFRARREALTSS